MEPKQISCDQEYLPATHQWFIAQNLESDNQIFFTMDKRLHDHYRYCRINELMHGRRIRACFHGWVILSNHPDNTLWSLWNPLTSKLIRLPPLIYKEKRSHECCLSAPPNDHGSIFLLTTTDIPTIVFCRLDRKRKRLKWTEISYAKQLKSINGVDRFLESPTCYNGKVYAMTIGPYDSSVIKVDILVKEKQVVINLLPFVKLPGTCSSRFNSCSRYIPFLKGSCTELFYIKADFINGKGIDYVYLFKLDITSMMWEEIADLKDAILFLHISSDYSTCYYRTTAVDLAFAGYVHIILDDSESVKIISSFHAKDRTMSISSMPCQVIENRATAWAMIEWRLEVDHVECMLEAEDTDTQIVARPIEGDFDGLTSESHVLNIPIHILEMIMELCSGIEYMKFRATCKHCYLAAPMIQWSTKTTLKRLHMYSLDSPWLMVLDNYRGIITFIDPLHGDRYFIKTPQELIKDYYQIYCCRFGWLLMYQYNGSMMFYNPFTSDIRKLPRAPYLESFCFSAPPTSPDCMVVGFSNHLEWHVFFHFVSRDLEWRFFPLNFGGDDPYSYHFPTFSGRDVYALCNNGGVDVFRYMNEDDDFSWEVIVDNIPISRCRSPTQYFLSICDQHSLLVIVAEFGESVEVFKLNEYGEWEKIDGLGKHMIYVSDTSCICLEAKSPEMENKIYFTRLLHDEDTKIVFYSLETCRYHTFDDKNIEEKSGVDLFGTKQHCNPHTWIEPNWS